MKHVLRLVQYAKPYWWLLIITGVSLLGDNWPQPGSTISDYEVNWDPN
ncbi:MAG TPA: hypothetical protein VFC74_09060 [Oscillospiraceae bacterium]|nr:hypothetical protein [Oscillospiraceae bacterium]